MAEPSDISPVMPVLPLVTAEQAKEGWAKFEALKACLLSAEDIATIKGKNYIKKSGWRKLGVFFGIGDTITEQTRTDRPDGSFMWKVAVQATAPNGRSSIGLGVCDSREREFAHSEHDVLATAHTRAKNRAISDLVGGGAVSAEELEGEEKPSEAVAVSSTPSITEALQSAGVDPRKVEITREGGRTYIYATSSLEDWTPAKIALAVIGYDWNPQAGRWEQRKG